MKLNAGCGTWYADGWVNLDCMRNDRTRPDVVGKVPFPFRTAAFDHVFLGHVLEHVPWHNLPGFLAEVRRVAEPRARVLATGPDVRRTIKVWQAGSVSWDLVLSVMEHQDQAHPHWPEAVHHWNCHQDRMEGVLEAAGFSQVREATLMDGWPVQGWDPSWQCSAEALA